MNFINLQQWLLPWECSPIIIALMLLTAIAYIRGREHQSASTWRQLAFWVGLLLLYTMTQTGFDYYAEHAFFMHRIQHTILHHIAPFLIALSTPGMALWAGIPQQIQLILKKILFSRPVNVLLTRLNHPAVAAILFCGLILLWLFPSIHFTAMLDWRWYRVMNWGMAVNGLMFWNLVLNNFCLRRESLSGPTRIMTMLAILPVQIAAGVVLFFASHELYSVYDICGRIYGNITALEDQQLGGLILWIPAAMMSVIGIVIVLKREWFKA